MNNKRQVGRPPNTVVLGLQAHIISSATIHREHTTLDLGISVKLSTAIKNCYRGLVFFLNSSTNIAGRNLRKSLNLLYGMYCSKFGDGLMEYHNSSSSKSI
jgi:hypothetical protein